MKRRSLLAMIPAASAMLALRANGAPIPGKSATSAGFGIAVQCWSFREFTLFEAIELAAGAGLDGLEVYAKQKIGGDFGNAIFGPGMTDEQTEAVIAKLAEHKLVIYNMGVLPVPADEAKARVIFDLAKRLNSYGITTESIDSIDTLEKLAAEYDIKVCFHNHPKPTKMWNPDTTLKALEGRHENLGFCADIGHWATSGLDPLEVVQKVAPRIHSFHFKDRAVIGEWSRDLPFGTGIINLSAILDEVRKHGFAGNVSIEYEHNWSANQCEIAQCAGYLRGYSGARG
ncbi:sugar phosphate isomerase/epimerase family protein [Luteolibacter algae]|uniref:Sugar phosphate isomerase/epimerase family protein n=1 Tax=Luteolibacter algae TaxID=454151 RepID=A0ABW5D370_9BACT